MSDGTPGDGEPGNVLAVAFEPDLPGPVMLRAAESVEEITSIIFTASLSTRVEPRAHSGRGSFSCHGIDALV